jgi:hypothetical protein
VTGRLADKTTKRARCQREERLGAAGVPVVFEPSGDGQGPDRSPAHARSEAGQTDHGRNVHAGPFGIHAAAEDTR